MIYNTINNSVQNKILSNKKWLMSEILLNIEYENNSRIIYYRFDCA